MRARLPAIAALALWTMTALPHSLALGQTKESPRAHLEFGLNLYRDGLFEPAADAFRAYLDQAGKRADAPRVRYLLAEALRRDGRLRAAAAAYRTLLRRHPGHERADEARFRVGELAERIGSAKEAARAYASVRSGRWRTEALYRIAALGLAARRWPDAVAALDAFLASAPKDPRAEAALFERAVALDRVPRPRAAERAYASVLRRFPENPRARAFMSRLAEIRLRLGKFEAAGKTLAALFRKYPREKKRAGARLAQAASFFGRRKYEDAGAAFAAVLRMKLSKAQRATAERGLASSWRRAGEHAKAAEAYRRLLRRRPDGSGYLPHFLESVKKAGGCRKKGGKYLASALDALEGGTPLSLAGRFRLADCLRGAGMKKEAARQYREVVRRAPNALEAVWSGLRLAAMAEKDAKREEEVLARYRQAFRSFRGLRESGKKIEPGLARAVYQGVLRAASIHGARKDCAGAVGLLKMVPEEFVPERSRAETAFLRAECAWEAGELEEAARRFRQVLLGEGPPALAARARYRLGEAARRRGDAREALRRFQDALPLLPEELRHEARLNMGALHRERGDFQKARAALLPLAHDEKVSAPRRRAIWYFLARTAADSRDWKGADAAFSSWDALAPPDPGEGLALWAFAALRGGGCGRALKISERALRLAASKEGKLALRRLRASCFLRRKNLAEAADELRRVVALAPKDAAAALELAEVFENMGSVDEAAGAYARFVAGFPRSGEAAAAALRLGALELRRGKPEAALRAFRAASKSKDANVSGPARLQVALWLERDGAKAEALELYESLPRLGAGEEEWARSAAWRAASIRESRREWKAAIRHYRGIAALAGRDAPARVGEEARRARARILRLESYLASVRERERKMKSRVPMLR